MKFKVLCGHSSFPNFLLVIFALLRETAASFLFASRVILLVLFPSHSICMPLGERANYGVLEKQLLREKLFKLSTGIAQCQGHTRDHLPTTCLHVNYLPSFCSCMNKPSRKVNTRNKCFFLKDRAGKGFHVYFVKNSYKVAKKKDMFLSFIKAFSFLAAPAMA